MQKSDRTHFILSPGRLRRKDNNLYFDKFNDEGGILTSKILPINAIDEIYILARVELDTYAMAFLADNNILLHIFSAYQSFRGSFFPNTSNSVNKSGFVLLAQLRAFDDLSKRLFIAREITRVRILNAAINCKAYGVSLDTTPHLDALARVCDIAAAMQWKAALPSSISRPGTKSSRISAVLNLRRAPNARRQIKLMPSLAM